MATYTLPDLPYDYAALEPHIMDVIATIRGSAQGPLVCAGTLRWHAAVN